MLVRRSFLPHYLSMVDVSHQRKVLLTGWDAADWENDRNRFGFDFWTDGANHRFEFHKRSQPFICTHNEPLSVIAVRICNEDCSGLRINR
jgi:hypothetical protein